MRRPVIRTAPNAERMLSDPIDRVNITAHTASIALGMLHAMYAADVECLAAPQVDVTLRLVVVDFGWKTGAPTPLVLINPKIVTRSDDVVTLEETCPSSPGQTLAARRNTWIDLSWQGFAGYNLDGRFEGDHAAMLQHAIDHLDGCGCNDPRAEI